MGLGLLVPGILLRFSLNIQPGKPNPTDVVEQTQDSTLPTETSGGYLLPVLLDGGKLQQMELEEYVACVVLAEMPASFESEALKAQAVVARTYALKRHRSDNKHEGGAVCTDPACCQAYCTREAYLKKGGSISSVEKVFQAVESTRGQVITYNGTLIEATYFSCSGGRTEDAVAVWGADIPYLQAVDSPGEESATHYMDTVTFSVKEFAQRMGLEQSRLTGNWIGAITYTSGGGVDTIRFAGQQFSGTTVRQKLNLRSTAFVITAVGSTVTVTTKGYGHRVGMSQYGAEAMAVSGKNHRQILSYYYQGTTLEENWYG